MNTSRCAGLSYAAAKAQNEREALETLRDQHTGKVAPIIRQLDEREALQQDIRTQRERKKVTLSKRLEKTMPERGQLESCIGNTLYAFSSRHWNISKKGDRTSCQVY